MTPRAPALPPEERRAAIIEAALPLVSTDGFAFTTKAVAEAAGIAEGTLFRIFPTKPELVHAVIRKVLDPTPICTQFAALRPATLTEAVEQLTEVLIESVKKTTALFSALHTQGGGYSPEKPGNNGHDHDHHQQRAEQLNQAMLAVLAPFADQLRSSPSETAALLRALVIACFHPLLNSGHFTTAAQITDHLLYGCARTHPDSDPREPSC